MAFLGGARASQLTRRGKLNMQWVPCACGHVVLLSLVYSVLLSNIAFAVASSATATPCTRTSYEYNRNGNDIHFDPAKRSYSIDVNIDQRVNPVTFKCGEEPLANEDLAFLELLTETFTQASIAMHEATRYNAHIGEVRFLLPDTWRTENFRENQDVVECHSSDPETSSIRIVENPTECSAKVRGTDCCGLPASGKMTLDSGVFFPCNRAADNCDDPAKKIVHEFAHLHWGIGDEYKKSNPSVPECPEGKENTKDGRGVSVMASTKDHAHFFCDNLARGDNASSSVLHNSNADTNHNELCQGRSAWEVLRQYQDFSNSHTKKPNTSLTPVFRYAVKCTGELNVFIVDVANRTTRPKNANRKQPINKFLGLVWRRIEGLFSTSTSNYANAAIITYDSSGKSQDVITKSPKVLLANVRGKTQLGKDMLQLRHGVNSVNAASLDKALDLALDLMQHVVWVTKQTHESSTRRAIVISKNLVSLSSSLCKPVPEDVPGAQLLFFSTSVPRNAIHPCNTSVPRRFCRHIHHLAHFTNYTAQCTRTVFGASAYIPQSRGTRTIAGNINMNAKTGRPAAGRMDYNIHVTVKINPPARFTLRFQFQHFDPNEVGRKINRTMNATLDHDEQIWHKGFEMSSSLDAVGFKLDITAHSRPGTYYLVVNGTPKLGLATMPPTPRRADDEWFRPLSSSKMGSTRSACNCL